MTFEQWWAKFGYPVIVKKIGSPVVADSLKDIIECAWATSIYNADEPVPPSVFEQWYVQDGVNRASQLARTTPDSFTGVGTVLRLAMAYSWNGAIDASIREIAAQLKAGNTVALCLEKLKTNIS